MEENPEIKEIEKLLKDKGIYFDNEGGDAATHNINIGIPRHVQSQVEKLRSFLQSLSCVYSEKRSDVSDIIDEFLKTGVNKAVGDDNWLESRFVYMDIPGTMLAVEYDTLTTHISYKDYSSDEWKTPAIEKYSDTGIYVAHADIDQKYQNDQIARKYLQLGFDPDQVRKCHSELIRIMNSDRKIPQISLTWCAEDFIERASDPDGSYGIKLKPKEVEYCLESALKTHDCNYGFTWETMDAILEEVFEKRKNTPRFLKCGGETYKWMYNVKQYSFWKTINEDESTTLVFKGKKLITSSDSQVTAESHIIYDMIMKGELEMDDVSEIIIDNFKDK